MELTAETEEREPLLLTMLLSEAPLEPAPLIVVYGLVLRLLYPPPITLDAEFLESPKRLVVLALAPLLLASL